jgi:hypothetical protein
MVCNTGVEKFLLQDNLFLQELSVFVLCCLKFRLCSFANVILNVAVLCGWESCVPSELKSAFEHLDQARVQMQY